MTWSTGTALMWIARRRASPKTCTERSTCIRRFRLACPEPGSEKTMAERLKPVDVVTVGVGLTGAIMAKELAATGLKVVGLERGPARDTVPDFQSPAIHDELRFAVRKALMQDNVKET